MLSTVGKRLLVQPVAGEAEQKILVLNKKPTQYNVTHIGEEVTLAKVGDKVYLDKFAGQEVVYDNITYIVINEDSILAKISG